MPLKLRQVNKLGSAAQSSTEEDKLESEGLWNETSISAYLISNPLHSVLFLYF